MKKRFKHVIPYELSGIATLLVDYLSRWGEEIEAMSLLLATLIITLIMDLEGFLDKPYISIIVGFIVAAEFVYILFVALRRRVLEYELWAAVYELQEHSANTESPNNSSHGGSRHR